MKPRTLKDPALILLRARAAWRADEPKQFLAGLKRVERKYRKSSQAVEAKILRAKYYSVDEPKQEPDRPANAAQALALAEEAEGEVAELPVGVGCAGSGAGAGLIGTPSNCNCGCEV